ncbi:MAG: MOSC domain-containing protein [Deltaproteobacteria bacterium]
MMTGRVFSVNVSTVKGGPKQMVTGAVLRAGHGIEDDAHAGPGRRQVSLLAVEVLEEAEKRSRDSQADLRPGIFAENITTQDVDLGRVRVGDTIRIGASVALRVTQLGKECHDGCAIMKRTGACVMPKKGVFAVVVTGGPVRVHDRVEIAGKPRGIFAWFRT